MIVVAFPITRIMSGVLGKSKRKHKILRNQIFLGVSSYNFHRGKINITKNVSLPSLLIYFSQSAVRNQMLAMESVILHMSRMTMMLT